MKALERRQETQGIFRTLLRHLRWKFLQSRKQTGIIMGELGDEATYKGDAEHEISPPIFSVK